MFLGGNTVKFIAIPKRNENICSNKNLYTSFQSSIIHKRQNVEATQMPINKRMDKEGMVCVYNGLLLCFAMLSHLSDVQQFVTS